MRELISFCKYTVRSRPDDQGSDSIKINQQTYPSITAFRGLTPIAIGSFFNTKCKVIEWNISSQHMQHEHDQENMDILQKCLIQLYG